MKILKEQARTGEFRISIKKYDDAEFKKTHDVRYDKNTKQYYAKKNQAVVGFKMVSSTQYEPLFRLW
jgi:hypothetical protein